MWPQSPCFNQSLFDLNALASAKACLTSTPFLEPKTIYPLRSLLTLRGSSMVLHQTTETSIDSTLRLTQDFHTRWYWRYQASNSYTLYTSLHINIDLPQKRACPTDENPGSSSSSWLQGEPPEFTCCCQERWAAGAVRYQSRGPIGELAMAGPAGCRPYRRAARGRLSHPSTRSTTLLSTCLPCTQTPAAHPPPPPRPPSTPSPHPPPPRPPPSPGRPVRGRGSLAFQRTFFLCVCGVFAKKGEK